MSTAADDAMKALQQGNLETVVALTRLSMENSRRMVEFQVSLARALFEDGLANMQALSQAADPKTAMELRARFAQTSAERMLSATRQIAEMAGEFQSEVSKAVLPAAAGEDMNAALRRLFPGMPFSPSDSLTAMQKAFETAREAYDQFARSSLQTLMPGAAPAPRKGTDKR